MFDTNKKFWFIRSNLNKLQCEYIAVNVKIRILCKWMHIFDAKLQFRPLNTAKLLWKLMSDYESF